MREINAGVMDGTSNPYLTLTLTLALTPNPDPNPNPNPDPNPDPDPSPNPDPDPNPNQAAVLQLRVLEMWAAASATGEEQCALLVERGMLAPPYPKP